MFDMMKMMGKLSELKAKVKEAQDNLSKIVHTAEAGAGLVKATVNGKKQVLKVEIDNELIKPEDKDTLQDLTVAAINKALAEVDDMAKQEMKKATEGVLPSIPGLDLSGFGL
jgi:DNA-binding YbaB/EbfC family protein